MPLPACRASLLEPPIITRPKDAGVFHHLSRPVPSRSTPSNQSHSLPLHHPQTMASHLVDAYEKLLVDNISTVNTVESTIRNVTWFLPGRFADADVASEGRELPSPATSTFADPQSMLSSPSCPAGTMRCSRSASRHPCPCPRIPSRPSQPFRSPSSALHRLRVECSPFFLQPRSTGDTRGTGQTSRRCTDERRARFRR